MERGRLSRAVGVRRSETMGLRLGLAILVAGCGGTGTSGSTAAPDGATACGVGTWELDESAGSCGQCGGNTDLVVIPISYGLATEGGTTTDSEGNVWQFDPATCSATLAGNCDASDAIDFDAGRATCSWTCAGACPACAAKCVLRRF